jgi:hypothetical protein
MRYHVEWDMVVSAGVLEMGRYMPVYHTGTSFCSWISYRNLSIYGSEVVVRVLEGRHLADRCILTRLEQCHLFLPSPLHACPRHGSWATFIRLSHARAKIDLKAHKDAFIGQWLLIQYIRGYPSYLELSATWGRAMPWQQEVHLIWVFVGLLYTDVSRVAQSI